MLGEQSNFQTDNQVNTANSSFFPQTSPPRPHTPAHPSPRLPPPLAMEAWQGAGHCLASLAASVAHARLWPAAPSPLPQREAPRSSPPPRRLLPPMPLLWQGPLRPPHHHHPRRPRLRCCRAAPAVYDKNIILLLLNNPINLSTGRKLTSCLFG